MVANPLALTSISTSGETHPEYLCLNLRAGSGGAFISVKRTAAALFDESKEQHQLLSHKLTHNTGQSAHVTT